MEVGEKQMWHLRLDIGLMAINLQGESPSAQ